ncbi:MazG-like family protein [Escherichia coli]
MNELITKVEQWAKDKGLNQADPKAQFLKVAEEFGEIASAMARSNDELFKDSVGDVIVTLIILSMQKGTNVQECLEMEIKGRTGKMVDGVFVKSSDLEESK